MSFQAQYDEYQQTLQSLQEHVVSLESQLYEHEIVVETLKGVPAERRAWRLVSSGDSGVVVTDKTDKDGGAVGSSSGALVETNAGEAQKKLEETIKGLKQLREKLEKEAAGVKKEFEEWRVKHNVKVVRSR